MILAQWYEQYKKFSISFRAKYFKPILKLLADLKITPNQITTFRLFFIIPIAYCFITESIWGVFVFYVLFWLFDLFDGALARYLNQTSDKGRFLDTLVDNFMYGVLMVGMIHLQLAWLWLLALNLVLEYLVQILGMIIRQPKLQSDWLFKAEANLPYFKSISHVGIFLFLLGFNFLNFIYYFLNLALAGLAVYFYIQIKNKDLNIDSK
ncbi:MAG: CDP-alcohol phosphatidyltransferase family protein [Candidatus Parcubacteria bacterium]|nr:CDP-alcohol phosphatidyltransferase family protein [Candidatus Parcubacteria bacterium]